MTRCPAGAACLTPPRVLPEGAASGAWGADAGTDSERTEARARWRKIEVRHLAALVAVAREGSFRRAADRLGYVPSAISNQVSRLETAAGTRLVQRASGSASVQLTLAGDALARHAAEIIARLDAARSEIGSLPTQTVETVRVAGLEHVAPLRLAQILRWFDKHHSCARVILEDAGSDELNLEQLAQGVLDLSVCVLPLIEGPFSYIAFERDPYVLVVASSSPLAARRAPPSAAEVGRLRLIIPASSGLPNPGEARLRQLGIDPRVPFRPESAATAQALVEAGLGEAIMPRAQFDPGHRGTVAIELPGLLPERTIALVAHAERDHSTAVRGFMRAVVLARGDDGADPGAAAAGQRFRS